MERMFIIMLNMSITAGIIALAVIFMRAILKKVPKWLICLMWGLVAVRLICPFTVESAFSLIPSKEIIPLDILMPDMFAINRGMSYYTYTFRYDGNDLIFAAFELSDIPVYEYKFGEAHMESPIPAGTVFTKVMKLTETNMMGSDFDSIKFDADGDGREEECILSYGPSSEIPQYFLTIKDNGITEFCQLFETDNELCFKVEEDRLKLHCVKGQLENRQL